MLVRGPGELLLLRATGDVRVSELLSVRVHVTGASRGLLRGHEALEARVAFETGAVRTARAPAGLGHRKGRVEALAGVLIDRLADGGPSVSFMHPLPSDRESPAPRGAVQGARAERLYERLGAGADAGDSGYTLVAARRAVRHDALVSPDGDDAIVVTGDEEPSTVLVEALLRELEKPSSALNSRKSSSRGPFSLPS